MHNTTKNIGNVKNTNKIEQLLNVELTIGELILLEQKCNKLAWFNAKLNKKLFYKYTTLRNKIDKLIRVKL